VNEAVLSGKSSLCKHAALQQSKRRCSSHRVLFCENVSSTIWGEQLFIQHLCSQREAASLKESSLDIILLDAF
jgi:hypothetical protein